jgi:acyl-CoA thioester hydrolase
MLMRVANPDLADYPVRSVEKLRYADTDRQGHISNAVFAVCSQNARMELLCDQGRVPLPPNTQFVIVKLVLEFRAEMHWPGTVEIGTRVARIGSSSVVLEQALCVGEACVAMADSTVVLHGRDDPTIDALATADSAGPERPGQAGSGTSAGARWAVATRALASSCRKTGDEAGGRRRVEVLRLDGVAATDRILGQGRVPLILVAGIGDGLARVARGADAGWSLWLALLVLIALRPEWPSPRTLVQNRPARQRYAAFFVRCGLRIRAIASAAAQ